MDNIFDLFHKTCRNFVLVVTLPVKVYASIPQPFRHIHNIPVKFIEILVTYCNDSAMLLRFKRCFTSCNVYEWEIWDVCELKFLRSSNIQECLWMATIYRYFVNKVPGLPKQLVN